jgi:hypothetical protein
MVIIRGKTDSYDHTDPNKKFQNRTDPDTQHWLYRKIRKNTYEN